MTDVFISYSRLDKDFVSKLHDALAAQNQDVWVDWQDIPPSQSWWDEIRRGIAKTNNFVVVLSPHSMASPVCQLEIEYARQQKKRIIPVLYTDYQRDLAMNAIQERLAKTEEITIRELWHGRTVEAVFEGNEGELKHINYFFFQDVSTFDERFRELLDTIRTDYEHKEQHTRLQLRASEWNRREQDASFLLLDTELADAQAWLAQASRKAPPPTDLQRHYIESSVKRNRNLHRIRQTAALGSLAAVIALVFASVAALIGRNALADANEASTQVALAHEELTHVPPTLTQVYNLVVEAQADASQVAADAAYFSLRQGWAATLAAGSVVLAEVNTPEPTQFVANLTEIAVLSAWQVEESHDFYGVAMVKVPAGCFYMGSVASYDEQPISLQCIEADFWIDKFEVTNAQYQAVTGQRSDSEFAGDLYPVDTIDWFQARDFCLARGARLPSEREWEYAARGPNSTVYPWGNHFDPSFVVNDRPEESGGLPAINENGEILRQGGASWVGAIDMAGNVAEWTNTIYDELDISRGLYDYVGLYPYPYRADDGREADESEDDYYNREDVLTLRGIRGGSYVELGSAIRTTIRQGLYPEEAYGFIGLRCVRSNL